VTPPTGTYRLAAATMRWRRGDACIHVGVAIALGLRHVGGDGGNTIRSMWWSWSHRRVAR
jgi:hypothetical protein